MGYNPEQKCLDCGEPTGRGERVMRCDSCNEIAKKAHALRYRGVRSCTRCEKPAEPRKRLCAGCGAAAAKAQPAKRAAISRRWRAKNPEKSRAASAANYSNHREETLRRQRIYDEAHRPEQASRQRRYNAKSKPWSRKRTAKLRAEANAAVPMTLPADIRDDAVSAIILAVLEGNLDQQKISELASNYIRAELAVKYRDQSLDEFIPGTSIPRIETVSA